MHPFASLKPEYSQLLSIMTVRPECRKAIDDAAARILSVRRNFEAVRAAIGVPVIFSGPSFYREADLNFTLSPAQGDPWRRVSRHVPRGVGPYRSWLDAAVAAYRINGLDKVGDGNWTLELTCFYLEILNGMGYRDEHGMHSPYLWGGTNIQTAGKYVEDGKFDPKEWDHQIGAVPLARRLIEIAPELTLQPAGIIAPPVSSGLAPMPRTAIVSPEISGTRWLQRSLNELGFEISEDGSYGRETRHAVAAFKRAFGLGDDGYADQETIEAIAQAVDSSRETSRDADAKPQPREAVSS